MKDTQLTTFVAEELTLLLSGIDLEATCAGKWWRPAVWAGKKDEKRGKTANKALHYK